MVDSFIFDATVELMQRRAAVMCVFLPFPGITTSQVKGMLQEYLDVEGRVPPEIVLFIATRGLQKRLEDLCTSNLIRDCLPEITRRSSPPPVRAIVANLDGRFVPVTKDSAPFATSECAAQIRQEGLLTLVRSHDIILNGSDRFHFIKPAGTHCKSFIRTANAFVSGAGTLFAALWLLPHITDNTRCIYTDTAGINAFVLSALLLRMQIDPSCHSPIVDSFGSYAGLNTYNFRYSHQSLFVISSSTSCGLERTLAARLRVPTSQVVTVFFFDATSGTTPAIMLCDVSSEYARRKDEFASFNGEQCPLCRSHVPAVAIGGDQFLLDVSSPEPILLKAEDAPDWLRTFARDFVGHGVLRVHRVIQSGHRRPREIFINLELVLALPSGDLDPFGKTAYLRSLTRRLETQVPASLKHIVYVADAGSKALAERIRGWFSETQRSGLTMLPHTEIPKSGIRSSALSTGTLMVVAGIVISGQSMMEINQLLRDREDDTVLYLAGMTRTRNRRRLDEITSNIQYGPDGGRHYSFLSIRDIFLPDNHIERPSPWSVETETWKSVRESLLTLTDAVAIREWCTKRIEHLEQSKATGMHEALFLP